MAEAAYELSSFVDEDFEELDNGVPEKDSELVLGLCEVYSNYKPQVLKIGKPHPQLLCEGGALSCVKPPPTDESKLLMEEHFYSSSGKQTPRLSNAQLEAVVYARQAHEEYFSNDEGTEVRLGFYLGDGTGTGKTRTIAGLIYENEKNKVYESVWITPSVGLFSTAMEEIKYFIPNVRILTIADVMGSYPKTRNVNKVLFMKYSDLIDKAKWKALQKWLTKDFNGLFIFDEAHRAKAACSTLKPSKCGESVILLQNLHPNARVIYSSATGASEPYHLSYMTRLGLWGPDKKYACCGELMDSLEKRGVGGLELLAMEMKMRGVFVSRQISYDNVKLMYKEVKLSPSFEPVHDRCSELWTLLAEYLQYLKKRKSASLDSNEVNVGQEVATMMGPFYAASLSFFSSLITSSKLPMVDHVARKSLEQNCSVIIGLQNTGEKKFAEFSKETWNAGKPFSNILGILRYTMLSMGIKLGCPRTYLNDGTEIKIGKWTDIDDKKADKLFRDRWMVPKVKKVKVHPTTLDDLLPENLSEDVLEDALVEDDEPESEDDFDAIKHVNKKRKTHEENQSCSDKNLEKWPRYSVGSFVADEHEALRNPLKLSWSYEKVKNNLTRSGLRRLYHELWLLLPINPLDELTHRLESPVDAKISYPIAELTGRQERYLCNEAFDWHTEKKQSLEKERMNFMGMGTQRKRVCIISNIASTGFSLHSDKASLNTERRVHITVEYAWGPDQLLQQLGRSHRSNQEYDPTYCVIKSPIPGEIRHVSVIAKRLKQLGAICQGQSRANPLDDRMSDVMCSNLGVQAINNAISTLNSSGDIVVQQLMCAVDMSKIKQGQRRLFSKSQDGEISRRFNRLLMLPLNLQRRFLQLVNNEIEALKGEENIQHEPIADFPAPSCDLNVSYVRKLVDDTGVSCELYKFKHCRTSEWMFVEGLWKANENEAHFYKNSYGEIMLAVWIQDNKDCFKAYYPYNRVPRTLGSDILKNWTACSYYDASTRWKSAVEALVKYPGCVHKGFGLSCKRTCTVKWGTIEFLVLCGFSNQFLSLLETESKKSFRLARVRYVDNNVPKSIVGVLIENETKDYIESEFLHYVKQ